ncbi:MAG: glycosyltransferase family 39 protein [Acidobacteria bacterium]|nr:glycosyltransferase family 39 protein [Acidobacteriota bacterium]
MGAVGRQHLRRLAARPGALLTAALVVLYVAARLWRLDASCLWFDELFSVHAARHTWAGLWRFAAADLIHPPLFYALLKVWTAAGGESLYWLRLFPFVASAAALVPLLLLARELRLGTFATNVALLSAAANGYLIKYAQEVRMYGLLLLLTLTSLWLFARLLKREGRARALLLALFFVNLLLVYTHYYGWLVVACEAALLAFKGRRRLGPFMLTAAGLAVAYVPWVVACAGAARAGGGLAQNIGWITRPGPQDLSELFALFNQPFYFRQSSADPLFVRAGALLGLLLVGLPLVALLFGRLRRRDAGEDVEGEAVGFLLTFSLLPVVLAFAASYVLPQSVWGTRHLIVAAGPYALLAGLALARLRPAWWRAAALVLLCCWLLLAGALVLIRREPMHVWCAWEGLAASAARDEARDSVGGAASSTDVYAFEDLVAYHLWFALEREGRFRVVSLKGTPGVSEDPAYFLPRDFDGVAVADSGALDGERFWAAFRDTSWDESRQPLKFILERGYRAERVYEASAQGQRAFLVLFVRTEKSK